MANFRTWSTTSEGVFIENTEEPGWTVGLILQGALILCHLGRTVKWLSGRIVFYCSCTCVFIDPLVNVPNLIEEEQPVAEVS